VVRFLRPLLRVAQETPPNKGEIMKGEVVMMTNNGSVTSIRIATSWTDDHDPVVIDIPFKTHDEAFFYFNALSNLFELPNTIVWSDGIAMRETNKRHTRSNYATK